jgi:hypothetical protein
MRSALSDLSGRVCQDPDPIVPIFRRLYAQLDGT